MLEFEIRGVSNKLDDVHFLIDYSRFVLSCNVTTYISRCC